MSESLETTFALLEKASELLDQILVKTETLRMEGGHVVGELREVEYILYRVTSLMQRMGLPPQVDQAITAMQRMILTIRMLQTALMFLNMATPYGWAMAAISAVGLGINAISMGDTLAGY